MKSGFSKTAGSNQMRWVILLLGVAVILPTVCLLWFMMQAVKNERLAVRQKMIDFYSERSLPLVKHLQERSSQFEQNIQQSDQISPFSFFSQLCLDRKEYAEGMIIYDNNDQLIFPVLSKQDNSIDTSKFEKGWQLEFVDCNYSDAIKEYERATMASSIPDVVFYGKLAEIRCYEKSGKTEQAVSICRELAYPGKHIINEYDSSDIIKTRLKLVELYSEYDKDAFKKEAIQLLSDMTANINEKTSSEVRIFVLGMLLKLINEKEFSGHQESILKAQKIIQAETLSLYAAENLLRKNVLAKMPEKISVAIDSADQMYGSLFRTQNRKVILFCKKSSLINVLRIFTEKLSDNIVTVSVFDDQRRLICGEEKKYDEAFLNIPIREYLPRWRFCFFFRNSDVFDNAASKQANVYMWTGGLVVLMILGSGVMAGQVVGRQIRLNRLKNDFIATVSHELKTPLSSMRVLVDTLLEKNYSDQKQAGEYLQLIAKENARLSRMIDNFLTFSRMERNKQAFEIVKADPAQIAKAAAQAVQTKFNQENCEFNIRIDEGLASIMADSDAMVTVLVNLLDNAYKYSYDEKQIELRVFNEDGFVCFSVKDNGIGLTARQRRKVFERFYQVDSSLSRRAEGTGLGLSIVKFIVDAHKGTIEVESKVGKGSEFILKMNI